MTSQLDKIHEDDKALLKAANGEGEERLTFEGRRRMFLAANWLLLARHRTTDRHHIQELNQVGVHLRHAQRALDRMGQ